MTAIPADLKYSKEHEWVRVDGKTVTIGITDYAQDQLGEVVFVDLPDEGENFTQGDAFGSVESVKSVSDVFCPVSGKVVEVNDPLLDGPEVLNEDPYGEGWMVKIEVSNLKELDSLFNKQQYQDFISEES